MLSKGSASLPVATEPLWTVEELAEYLKLEPATIRSMAREGRLPGIKVGRVWRFRRVELQDVLNKDKDL